MKVTHKKIQNWYHRFGRTTLPWRNTTDPYKIYLSEVMLQQTQVSTVLERFYFPFLRAFPTLKALGDAPLDRVLKMWEGLGYYNRAKNLHRTAQMVTHLPQELDALQALPGIGINTAHAIATFAYHQPVPIMEANVKRILCRIHQLTNPKPKELWAYAYEMVDKENPYIYNQAMMDIGSLICTPTSPSCHLCPLESICQGKENPTQYPQKKKRVVPTREEYIILYHHQGRLALTQREGKFLHGLWGFTSTQNPLDEAEPIGCVTHTYTHFKLICHLYLLEESTPSQSHYFTPKEIRKLAISKVDDKILNVYLDTMASLFT